MKKYLLSLTVASLLISPLLFADTTPDTMGTMGTMGPTQQNTDQKTDPGVTPTTQAAVPDTSTTTVTTPTTNVSTNASTLTDVQLKSMSGSIIPASIDQQYLVGITVGDKLEVTSLGTPTPTDTDTAVSNDTTQ